MKPTPLTQSIVILFLLNIIPFLLVNAMKHWLIMNYWFFLLGWILYCSRILFEYVLRLRMCTNTTGSRIPSSVIIKYFCLRISSGFCPPFTISIHPSDLTPMPRPCFLQCEQEVWCAKASRVHLLTLPPIVFQLIF